MTARPVRVPRPGSVVRRRVRVTVLLAVAAGVAALLQAVVAPPAVARPGDPCTYPGGVVQPGVACNTPPGTAHLVSRFGGWADMSDAQFAAMLQLEDEANAVVRTRHGMSDTPQAHDQVVRYAPAELRAALWARLVEAIGDDQPTPTESVAVSWIGQQAQAHQLAVATAARAEYDRWRGDICHYLPPAPFDSSAEWPDPVGGYPGWCYGGGSPPIDLGPATPSVEQFTKWGAAKVDGGLTSDTTATSAAMLTTAAGIGLGAGAAAGFLTGAAAVTAVTWAGLAPAIAVLFPHAAIDIVAGVAEVTAAWSGTIGLGAVTSVATTILLAVFIAVVAGFQVFTADQVPGKLDELVDHARTTVPTLRDLLADDSGRRQLFTDFVAATPDRCSSVSRGTTGGATVIDPSCYQPQIPSTVTRTPNDPVFVTTSQDGTTTPPSTSETLLLGQPVNQGFPGTVEVRDGWFVVGGGAPQLEFAYVDWHGVNRIARHVVDGQGRHLWLSYPFDVTDPSTLQCGTDQDGTCVLSPDLQLRDYRGLPMTVTMTANHPPSSSIVFTFPGAVTVGQPVTLGALTVPAGTPADPDGDSVTDSWTVESDQPCLTSSPTDVFWRCDRPGVIVVGPPPTRDGPHGGYLEDTVGGGVVWNTPGTYRVTLHRRDTFGAVTSVQADITVSSPAASWTAACSTCTTSPRKPVTVTGVIVAGRSRDRETLTIDWGDGSTTSAIPSSVDDCRGNTTIDNPCSPTARVVAPGLAATFQNSVQAGWTATHTYAAPGDYPVSVGVVDTGDVTTGGPSSFTAHVTPTAVATPDSYLLPTTGDRTLTVAAPGVLGNDTVAADATGRTAELVTAPSRGALTLRADGSFTYVPTPGTAGVDSFTYRAVDNFGEKSPATTVALRNAPGAATDAFVTPRDQVLTVAAPGLLANDAVPRYAGAPTATVRVTKDVDPSAGSLVVAPDGSLTFTPKVTAYGFVYFFTYVVTVEGVDSPPVDSTIEVDAGAPSRLAITGPAGLRAGEPTALSVQVQDAYGAVVPGAPAAALTTATTGASCNGFVCTATKAGTIRVSATASGLQATQDFPVAAAAPAVVNRTGDNQATPAGTGYRAPLGATITDPYGNPVAGVPVTFTLPAGVTFVGGSATAQVATARSGTASAPRIVTTGLRGAYTATAVAVGVSRPSVYGFAVVAPTSARADLVVRSTTPATVRTGHTGTVTVVVRNAGPKPAVGLRTTLVLPTGWSVVSPTGSAIAGGGAAVVDRASLVSGGTVTYRFQVRAPAVKGFATLGASALSGTTDPHPADNTAALTTKVV